MITTRTCTMTLEQFLKELHQVSDYFSWRSHVHCAGIRGEKQGRQFCPLTAVAEALYGEYFGVRRWHRAAQVMGLPRDIAEQVAETSDFGILFNTENEALDKRLRAAVGLV